jgi:hypothetical protein
MAKKNQQDTASSQTNSFIKGLNKDSDPLFVQEGMWTHARNAVNNTSEGDVGTLSNEESNALCAQAGTTLGTLYTYIVGAIHLFSDKWIIYTVGYDSQNTKPVNSEIGLFEGDLCKYKPIVQDRCLNFSKLHLVTGASKLKDDCTWQVYWADNLNPDRYLNIGDPKTWPPDNYVWIGGGVGSTNANLYSDGNGNTMYWPNVPWIEECKQLPGGLPTDCKVCSPIKPLQLNCERLRLATLVKTPCLDINISQQQGVIENGSYAVAAAYVLNRERVTNYFSNSYIQPVFNAINERGAFEITVDADSEHFEEFELVVIRFIDQNLSAKRVGYYSTRTTKIILDQLRETAETVPVENLILQNPVFEKSEQMVEVNNYLLRIGPTSKFDFNYQPLANLIQANWVCVEYPETYYVDGGKHTSYLRDEVYAFFIRWVYNTGDKSASYHIPGRPPADFNYNGVTYNDLDPYSNITGTTLPGDTQFFQSINTATTTSIVSSTLPDGGVVIGRGKMGYWQSAEKYPDFQADVWNSSAHCWTNTTDPNFDLCGKPIRHHKFPDNSVNGLCYHFQQKSSGFYINLMGVEFTNIILPKDNDGNDIPGIVGYEILRGSRHGNKSILAKGMINNFRTYKLRGSADDDNVTGLYANYPFNCIVPQQNDLNSPGDFNYLYNDPFITVRNNNDNKVNQTIPRDIISFHSPDTSFINPYLSTTEIKMYGYLEGTAEQRFIEPSKHPEFKLLTNKIVIFALVNGIIEALLNSIGEIKINYPAGNFTKPEFPIFASGTTTPTLPLPPIPALIPSLSGTDGTANGITAANTDITLGSAINAYFAAGGPIFEMLGTFSGVGLDTAFNTANTAMRGAGVYTLPTYDKTYTGKEMLGGIANGFLSGLFGGGDIWYYFIKGTQDAVNTLYAIAKKRQYALEQVGYGEYTKFRPANKSKDFRYIMKNGQYVYDQSQFLPEFTDSSGNSVKYRVNNIKRPKLVVLRTVKSDINETTDGPYYLLNANGYSIDQSSMTLGHAIRTFNSNAMIPLASNFTPGKINWTPRGKLKPFSNTIASHYVGLKYRIENQYGQLDSVQQVVATPCEQKLDFNTTIGPNGVAPFNLTGVCGNSNFQQNITSTPVIFGGDTYINRFTEKNIMHMFYDWLYDVPDNIEWNYFLNQMIPEPRFQVNSQPWDISDFNLGNLITNVTNWFGPNPDYGDGLLPSQSYDLDNVGYNLGNNNWFPIGYPGFLSVTNSYFYTSINGIRDFFVESEVLADFRDIGTFAWQRPYSKYNYTDLPSLFDSNPAVLTKGNFYAYDYTLSASRFLFNQYFTAGFLQGVTYDPNVAELCYTSYPNRIMYSLKQQEDKLIDGWLTYMPLNKVDFKSRLSSVKNFAKTGMFITFQNDSPLIYQGTDTLQLDDSGTAVTVGDAALFSRDPQNIVVAEKPYEYGSSQNRYGVVSTPAGLYYISQNQGKIFSYRQGLEEISQTGMKWWFSEFLPYKLLEDFPSYPHFDNPVAGIACTASYDNDNSVLYFSKRDFKLKDEYKGLVTYDDIYDDFLIKTANGGVSTVVKAKIGDTRYFEDASWTISYDPKAQFWISFHDWHPNFYVPSKGSFFTTKGNGIWKHSAFCNDYCNFYGVQHPFEVELPVVTAQMINTIKSIEYYLECYRRDRNLCVDQFHVLDYNFDQAVIFNSEQASGYLNLNLYPKNDIPLSLQFPRLASNLASYDILYAKEEQKYRINQFWDITKDRGEFPIGSSYPPAQGPYFPDPNSTVLLGNYEDYNVWVTSSNGYVKILNPLNLDYAKPQLERKKFRHYINFIKLMKSNSRDTNMILKIVNTKTQMSPR